MNTNKQTKRHRWEKLGAHDAQVSGARWWVCKDCGLKRCTEFLEDNLYEMDIRVWRRHAPPCPPEATQVEEKE